MKFKKSKISGYKLALLSNIFTSYSISAWFTSIFVQPRLFSLPFLISKSFRFRYNRWNLLIGVNILITVLVPVIGYFFGRQFNFLDIAYILSAIYAFFFINSVVRSIDHIRLFDSFLKITLLLNICYVVIQLIFYYGGLHHLTMVHSNVPFQISSGYSIQPGVFFNIPRYTGLFIESGPFTFFLCLTFLYLIQKKSVFPGYLKILVFIIILFSQSKFLFVFLPVILLELIIKRIFSRFYKFTTTPFVFFLGMIVVFFLALNVIFTDFGFTDYLAKTVPAYEQRMTGIRTSLSSLLEIEPFGKGLLGTNNETAGAKFVLNGIDIFSIVLVGYGLIMGTIMILTYLLFPVIAKLDYKFTFCIVLVLGFLSSGSFLIPQYLFALVYPVITHYQNSGKNRYVNPSKISS